MEQHFIKYIYAFFKYLIEIYGFSIKTELGEGQSYMIEYSSKTFVIKIEKYHREFYATLYKLGDEDNAVNLFNLLEYLNRGNSNAPKSDYFRKEDSTEESYRKQLKHISTVIHDNYEAIDDFFGSIKYESNVTELRKFILTKYPELFKKT